MSSVVIAHIVPVVSSVLIVPIGPIVSFLFTVSLASSVLTVPK